MGRRRTKDLELPPHVYRKGGRYYYGRQGLALGGDKAQMLRRYAELHGTQLGTNTFAAAAAAYRKDPIDGLPSKAPKTQAEYDRQLEVLCKVFGAMPLAQIQPRHVKAYLKARGGTVAATREKAVLSAVFNFARGEGLTDAPNPCAGIRGRKAGRGVYVTDGEYAAVWRLADPATRDFLDLLYLTGQDAGVVVRMTVAAVRDGALWSQRTKTGAKTRIVVSDALETILARLTQGAGPARRLLVDEARQPFTLGALRKRFHKARAAAGQTWQLRDLRAKAATDVGASEARKLLAHAQATTTDGYIRQVAGELSTGPATTPAERITETR